MFVLARLIYITIMQRTVEPKLKERINGTSLHLALDEKCQYGIVVMLARHIQHIASPGLAASEE